MLEYSGVRYAAHPARPAARVSENGNMAGQYSVSATGKSGTKILFDIVRKIDLSISLGDLAQEFVRCLPDPYAVKAMKVGAAETGPFKDVLLSEQSSILSDMGYRFIVCYYDAPDREEEPVTTNALAVLMASPARYARSVLPKKKTRSSGVSDGALSSYDILYNRLIDLLHAQNLAYESSKI